MHKIKAKNKRLKKFFRRIWNWINIKKMEIKISR